MSETRPVRKIASRTRDLVAEVQALRAFGDDRAIKVLEVDLDERSALLERVIPGTTLAASASEDEALDAVAVLFRAGWPAIPSPSVAKPVREFVAALGAPRFARARDMLTELLADAGPPMLLHGDLHYENILVSDR